jgi:ribulose-phosphate 3-epimerase
MVKIGASLLAVIDKDVDSISKELGISGIDFLSFDIMDGKFVSSSAFNTETIKKIRSNTKLPIEAHLMIEGPENHIQEFIDAGCDIITVHVEVCNDIDQTISIIKEAGKKVSFALNPETNISIIENYLDKLDFVMCMSVNPGRGGQEFIDISDKISSLRKLIEERGLDTKIMIDGGMNKETSAIVRKAGADHIISGSYLFSKSISEAIDDLRGN